MKKIIKWFAILLVSTCLAVVLLATFLFKFEYSVPNAQIIGQMIWFPEPTATGLSIVENKHPIYTIRITCGSPDNICHEGLFEYKGNTLSKIEIRDFASYLGEEITLTNGETLEPMD
ncbi:hypothetical protein FXE51_15490 [Vibrio mimicus]|nr:hypothetical protein FXE98_08230 [Vibrio cholerae]TXZ74370.1 hypothetical protein FXE51_15490 [Vibrio mimicus]